MSRVEEYELEKNITTKKGDKLKNSPKRIDFKASKESTKNIADISKKSRSVKQPSSSYNKTI